MTDTICAIATPPGRGGVGIVRISGPDVPALAERLLGACPKPRRVARARVVDADGQRLDDGLALYFRAPASFTGEHVLELQLHGSPIVLEQVVSAAVAGGARRAEPGEFSRRAFLNDKLDLAQAEAVADLIAATSEQAARAARRSLEGQFSEAVHALAERITRLRVHVEAALDFPDEDIDFLADGDVQAATEACLRSTGELLERARAGRVVNDGIRIAIVGRPNAGKSSLFNALVQRDAAIVTEIPGTTRDILRETVHFNGIPAMLADTAGLRETDDPVEREGVRRAEAELAEADVVLWVRDAADLHDEQRPPTDRPLIEVHNKIDRVVESAGRQGRLVRLSARTGDGLGALDAALNDALGVELEASALVSARARHVECIDRARRHLDTGHAELLATGSGELLAEELREAADALGEITGRLHSDELLGRIFSSFCIGK
ncbi:tRNA uridine-5-carboxymethylaminomethyl(34) synthesis GTPase MnmE [Wenzhouxiangella sp. XN79A]|uniref:tRNA uridine-5-carboxymethylaminomethyl(34) synthesis GTPase MnmE n=1 Tax=Wenzhouxiangella sp. XN79A TaxID=2724193 RepID=UPI00144AEE35|nr:tRNA uridine-5-carboxymethylaminomethyl(34) synthesis GTPase MnmE [Wenzhouxiangella sp. XN79A]NKI35711.1 tRNA uridine-5-carboxymethylaminomethyl(34) synthesis GTPase MnmE [Wenzhouxiangella sp. XN79A]